MSKSLPYFRWYPADAETDERYSAMTDAQLGFYHRCLNRSWINGGLPVNLAELAAAMKVRRSYLDKMWPVVGKCFVQSNGARPRYINPRQEKEREHATVQSERNTGAARSRHASALQHARAPAESESDSRSEKQEESSLRENAIPDLAPSPYWATDETYTPFVEAWRDVAEVTGKPLIDEDFVDAHFRWGRLAFEQKLQATLGVKERLRLGVWSAATDPQYIPLPDRYLQKEYKRRVVPPKTRDSAKYNGAENPHEIEYPEL